MRDDGIDGYYVASAAAVLLMNSAYIRVLLFEAAIIATLLALGRIFA
jgi:hypothetical protein